MQRFTIHWAPVRRTDGVVLFALWPAPVNADVCFERAGFTDFEDADDHWDACADGLLTRLLQALNTFGSPQLMSKPVEKHLSWYRRLFEKPEVFDLRQQIELPIDWDWLPDCIVSFGGSSVSLRTRGGHHIFWITLPESESEAFSSLVREIGAGHPIVRTDLKWEYLA